MKGKLIEIKKWFFDFDENGKIIYGGKRRYEVAYANKKHIESRLSEGFDVYYYKNPDRKDGLWQHISYTPRNENNIFNLLGMCDGMEQIWDYRIVAISKNNT
jgi:hypothetical protein